MGWFGKKGKKPPSETGPAIVFESLTGDDQQRQANTIAVRQVEALVPVKELMYDALSKRSTRILLDYTAQSVSVRFLVDGVWHNLPARDRETGDAMLFVLKRLSNAIPEERRAKQTGKFRAEMNSDRVECEMTSQGVPTGERVIIDVLVKTVKYETLEDLGMRTKMRESLQEMLGGKTGFVILSAMPEGGLSTTWQVGLSSTDRYMRDFVGIDDKANPEPEVQNIDMQLFDRDLGETALTPLHSMMLKEPEALAVPDLFDGKTIDALCDQVNDNGKLLVGAVRAKEAVEALLRVLHMKPTPVKFAKAVTAVVCQRLIRKLCDACKQPFQPQPQLLQRLGIPMGRVQQLYQQFQPPTPEQLEEMNKERKKKGEPEEPAVCPACGGVGYRGRTAIYELLIINDHIREALTKNPKMEVLRDIARKTGHRTLQEEGIVHVATGATSVQELQRVLSQ
jgi:type II secretory ATPase GspE/PulE/Tfp pilus assembly ATPase PilB-like protein